MVTFFKMMKIKRSVWLFICLKFFFMNGAEAQDTSNIHFNQQLTFICDNNFLLFNGEDGYYTSGLFARYDRVRKKSARKVLKQIWSVELSQQIFTAHSRKILPEDTPQFPGGTDEIDRPIAGYLYLKASMNTVVNRTTLLYLGASVGTIGTFSFGEEAYAFWHKVIGVKSHWNWIWDYQVDDYWGVNVHGTFAKAFLKSKHIHLTSISESTLGTGFIDFSQSFLFQIGQLVSMDNSGYWNNRLGVTSLRPKQSELYVYFKPMVTYQIYNSTIEGGLFASSQEGIVSEPESFVLINECGLRYSTMRYCLGYAVVWQSREVKEQFNTQAYGSLVFAYRFGKK